MALSVPKIPHIAVDFFFAFGRFEFSLKRLPRYRYMWKDVPMADWRKFAQTPAVSALFAQLIGDSVAAPIIQHPPAALIVKNDEVTFGPRPKSCENMSDVCDALKNARNNLFHGEKGMLIDPRDINLIAAGMRILEAMLPVDADVERNYGH